MATHQMGEREYPVDPPRPTSPLQILENAITRYKMANLTPLAIVAVTENFMMRLHNQLKEEWPNLAEPGAPFPPLEAFMAGEVEILGVRIVHQVRVCSIV